jgi:hypothetical protein
MTAARTVFLSEIQSKTAFRRLRRADAEKCAPLLDAALSRQSTNHLQTVRANEPLTPCRTRHGARQQAGRSNEEDKSQSAGGAGNQKDTGHARNLEQ